MVPMKSLPKQLLGRQGGRECRCSLLQRWTNCGLLQIDRSQQYLMAYQEYQDVFPIILLGDASVGKTCIIHNFVKGTASIANHKPTLGIDYLSKNIPLTHYTVKAQIWDTAGQQNYRSVTVDFMRKAAGALVVFDLTNRKSFSSVPYWIETLREKASNEQVQIVLVGNKLDKAQFRTVSLGEGQQMARQYGLGYMQVSAGDLGLLSSMFKDICQRVARAKSGEYRPAEKVGTHLGEVPADLGTEKKKGCC